MVTRILGEVQDDYREWLLEDPIDLSRKVSITEALLPKHKSNHEVLRRALFSEIKHEAKPGFLAKAIAKFATTPIQGSRRRNPGVRIATLNFDDLLEQALREADPSRNWKSRVAPGLTQWLNERVPASVLHLHGLVPSDGSQIQEPIVLGEADFVIHGSQVREALVQLMTGSHCIFVGLSMTDPNIVGALLDERVRDTDEFCRFAIVSPETPPPQLTESATTKNRTYEQYSRLRGQATARYLGVTPIFLNSISQNSQLFVEMALARANPSRYMAKDSPIRYGNRLLPLIRKIHFHAGLADRSGKPDWRTQQQSRVSKALADRLGDIVKLMDELARSLDYSEALGHRLQAQLQGDEYFGLFLWARALPDEMGNPEFALRLAGTSAYLHHNKATSALTVPIAPNTGYPAADAVYYGNARLATLNHSTDPRPMWKSMFAVPVSVEVSGADVNCGAISINSSLPADATVDLRSVLAYLEPLHQDRLTDALMQVAVDVFPNP